MKTPTATESLLPSPAPASESLESATFSKMFSREQRLADLRADSEIIRFFSRKNIFITGGTGFMGKVLIYKLAETVEDLGQIFVLIRSKGGKSPQARLDQLLVQEPFKRLVASKPDLLAGKMVAVEGDVTLERLGMSIKDYQRVESQVSVIYHVAATVKFEEDLTKSVLMNVRGTASVMELARKVGLPRLAAFVHVSTAYTHCYSDQLIRERVYPSTRNPNEIVELCEKGDPELIDSPEFTRKVIGDHPNTYTFTKEIAEGIVNEARGSLPVAIVRPSIVIAAINDPFPGWVDNLYGPTGMLIGANVGLLRTMYVRREKKADLLPVDMGVGLLCAAAWKTSKDFLAKIGQVGQQPAALAAADVTAELTEGARLRLTAGLPCNGKLDVNSNTRVMTSEGSSQDHQEGEDLVEEIQREGHGRSQGDQGGFGCPVYNCVTGNSAPLLWGDIEKMGNELILQYPLEKMLWYPGGSFKATHAVNQAFALFQHRLSAVVFDTIFTLMGRQPFVYKMMLKAEKAMGALSFFATREWSWETDNLNSLADELNEADKAIFNFDMRGFQDWPGYFEEYVKGCRQYLVKNDPASLGECRDRLKWFYAAHLGFRFFCLAGLAFLLYVCLFN